MPGEQDGMVMAVNPLIPDLPNLDKPLCTASLTSIPSSTNQLSITLHHSWEHSWEHSCVMELSSLAHPTLHDMTIEYITKKNNK